jgi:nucleoside-diphosphate-sugar epimerase
MLCAVVRHIPQDAPKAINWVTADLRAADWTSTLPNEDFDTIIHLAQSKHHRDFPRETSDIFGINVKATVDLSQWALEHHVGRFLFASTGNVYGSRNRVHSEDDYCAPETMYAASKLSAEILLKPFSDFMNISVLRFFGVYGPGQINAMLPGVIQRFNSGKEITLAGNIGVKFNPIYVMDCVSAIHRISTVSSSSRYEVLNVGGSEVTDLKQVTMLLEKLSNKKALTRITSDTPKQLVGSIEKFRRLCGFSEHVPFQEGLRRTMQFLQKSI